MSRPHPSSLADEAQGRPLCHSVLEFVWQQGKVSRADIARATGLARSTVSEIVSDLLKTGLISEAGDGPSRGGRRPILLNFVDSAYVILGVDMGSTHVSVVLTDLRGRELDWEHRDHPVRTDPEGTEQLILDLCEEILARYEGSRKRLLGVGVAVPSPVDPLRPKQVSDLLLPHWRGRGVLEQLQAIYGVPVLVENDANLGALAEHWWGAGRGFDDFTYIKLGRGVGNGIILGGEIYRGTTGVAGEIGHMVIEPHGELCSCGNRGCLETLVGTAALSRRVQELLKEHPESALSQVKEVTIEAIEDAALAEDPLAKTLVREAALNLASPVAVILNLLNPSAVIVGGSLSRLGTMLLAPLKEAAKNQTLVYSAAASRIVVSELGPRSIAKGAATLVLDSALASPSMFPSFEAA